MSLPHDMDVVAIAQPGGPGVLDLRRRPVPSPGHGQILIRVAYAGVNRPDVLQRQGAYAPPPGASDLPGLECSGHVAAIGPGVTRWAVGDAVCALLPGGGYAEYVAVPEGQLTPIPKGLTVEETAGVVEVACTVWSNLGMVAGIQEGDRVLIHGGAGGVGSFAIQLCKAMGCEVAVTAGSAEKLEYCRQLGADVLINYKEQDFAEELPGWADAILDVVGGPYLE